MYDGHVSPDVYPAPRNVFYDLFVSPRKLKEFGTDLRPMVYTMTYAWLQQGVLCLMRTNTVAVGRRGLRNNVPSPTATVIPPAIHSLHSTSVETARGYDVPERVRELLQRLFVCVPLCPAGPESPLPTVAGGPSSLCSLPQSEGRRRKIVRIGSHQVEADPDDPDIYNPTVAELDWLKTPAVVSVLEAHDRADAAAEARRLDSDAELARALSQEAVDRFTAQTSQVAADEQLAHSLSQQIMQNYGNQDPRTPVRASQRSQRNNTVARMSSAQARQQRVPNARATSEPPVSTIPLTRHRMLQAAIQEVFNEESSPIPAQSTAGTRLSVPRQPMQSTRRPPHTPVPSQPVEVSAPPPYYSVFDTQLFPSARFPLDGDIANSTREIRLSSDPVGGYAGAWIEIVGDQSNVSRSYLNSQVRGAVQSYGRPDIWRGCLEDSLGTLYSTPDLPDRNPKAPQIQGLVHALMMDYNAYRLRVGIVSHLHTSSSRVYM